MAKLLAHSTEGIERTEDVTIKGNTTFRSILLGNKVLRGLKENGYVKPSPIQLKAIPVGRCGFDLMVKSKSGTGKTLIFTIIALENVDVTKEAVQVLIIAPAREIAIQITDVISQIGCFTEGLKVQSFIGGMAFAEDKEKCNNCHIAIGTPGRLKHLVNEKLLKIDSVRLFVLDEVDKLAEMSFLNDINDIYNNLPIKKQILTTSATYPEDLQTFLSQYMLSPTFINTEVNSPLLLGLKQFVKVIECQSNAVQQMQVKNDTLINILSSISFTQCLIFSNYQSRAESISNFLNQKGWASTFISAAQSQNKRLSALNDLKEFKCRIMLSTDLIARGIDAANVDLVINYDIPADAMTYIHRMGRAGRFGSSGVCINLTFAGKELAHLQNLLGSIGGSELSVPILPEYTGSLNDLLKLDISQDQHINSIVSNNIKDVIRGKIMELKADKFDSIGKTDKLDSKGKTDKNLKNKAKDKKTNEEKASDDMKISNDTSELEKIKEQIENMDTTDILESIASGSFNSEMKGSEKGDQQDTFCKNKALLSVAKIVGADSSKGKEEETSINEYLNVLKTQENNLLSNITQKNIPEISEKMDDTDDNDSPGKVTVSNTSEYSSISTENSQNLNKTSNSDVSLETDKNVNKIYDMENIFHLGYDSIIKSDGKAWKDWKAARDKELAEKQQNAINEEYYSQNYIVGANNEPVEMMKWVPEQEQTYSIPTQNAAVAEANAVYEYEHFYNYFEKCSDHLWEHGLNFDSIKKFDEWFSYEWESQLYTIRNYVQHNIYIQEMSKLQNYSGLGIKGHYT